MKSFMNLVLNEIIKVWKQTGYRVIIFIMIGFSLLIPLLNFLISGELFAETAEDEYEYYLEWADEVEEPIEAEFYNTVADCYKFFIDNGIADGWQYQNYINDYVRLVVEETAYRLIAEGKYTVDEVVKMFSVDVIDKAQAQTRYNDAKAKRTELEERIFESEREYISVQIAEKKLSIAELETAVAMAEESYKLIGDDRTRIDYRQVKAELDFAVSELRCLEIMDEKNVGPDSWEYQLLSREMHSNAITAVASMPVAEEDFELFYRDKYFSYKSYVKQQESAVKHYQKEFDKGVYAIENGLDIYNVSVDTETRTSMDSVISYIGIVMTILVATMIAGEFGRGTVRLLLIRPRSRIRIITSKLVAACFIFFAFTFVCLVPVAIENLLFYGFGSFFTPVSVGNTFIKIPAVLLTLGSLSVAMLTVFADMSIAAIFASLTKKTGVAIVLPLVLKFAVASVVSTIGTMLITLWPGLFGWLAYSPIPYISMTVEAMNGSLLLGGSNSWMLNIWVGIIYHIIFTALLVWLTVIRFKRVDIK